MASNNPSLGDLPGFREGFAFYLSPRDSDGYAVVVAGEPMPEDPQWLLLIGFRVGHGRMDLVAHLVMPTPETWYKRSAEGPKLLEQFAELVKLRAQTPDCYLTTATVRSAARTELELWVRQFVHFKIPAGRNVDLFTAVGLDGGQPGKRTGPTDRKVLRLAKIARRYAELVRTTRTPKAQLAQEFSLAENTIQSYLHQARTEGLLTSHGRGVAGGTLTGHAEQILRDEVT